MIVIRHNIASDIVDVPIDLVDIAVLEREVLGVGKHLAMTDTDKFQTDCSIMVFCKSTGW